MLDRSLFGAIFVWMTKRLHPAAWACSCIKTASFRVARQTLAAAAIMLVCEFAFAGGAKQVPISTGTANEFTLEMFLDRLMLAESGGRMNARNARSTAVGPFQFLASTWLQITRTSFATETAELKPHEVLELRTDMAFARRAAQIYTQANAAHLVASGHQATFAHLRLAFLVGPAGAVRVLSAKPETPVLQLLGTTVVGANPFMRPMTAADLIQRAARDVAADVRVDIGLTPPADAVGGAMAAPRLVQP